MFSSQMQMNNFHILIICFIKKFCKFVYVLFLKKNVNYLFNVMNEALAAWNWKLKSLSTGACPWNDVPTIIMRIFYCKVFGCLLSLELNILNMRIIFFVYFTSEQHSKILVCFIPNIKTDWRIFEILQSFSFIFV